VILLSPLVAAVSSVQDTAMSESSPDYELLLAPSKKLACVLPLC